VRTPGLVEVGSLSSGHRRKVPGVLSHFAAFVNL